MPHFIGYKFHSCLKIDWFNLLTAGGSIITECNHRSPIGTRGKKFTELKKMGKKEKILTDQCIDDNLPRLSDNSAHNKILCSCYFHEPQDRKIELLRRAVVVLFRMLAIVSTNLSLGRSLRKTKICSEIFNFLNFLPARFFWNIFKVHLLIRKDFPTPKTEFSKNSCLVFQLDLT